MPRVPTLEEQASLNPLRGELRARASADDFGAGLGRSLEQGGQKLAQAGQVGEKIALDMQQRHNEAVAKETYTTLSNGVRDALRNPENGYLSQRGRNALDARETAAERIRELHRKAKEGLTPAQVLLFDRVAQAKVDSSLDLVANHARSEALQYENQMAEAHVSTLIQDAQNNAGDRAAVDGLTASIEHELIETAKRNGWHEDVLEVKLRDVYTKIHGGIVAQQIDAGDVGAAKDWLQGYGHLVDPSTRAKLDKALETADLRGQSQAQADRIAASTPGYKDQLAEARKISDPQVRDETVKRINARHAEGEALRREQQRELTKQAWTTAMEEGSVEAIPATTWAELEPLTQRQIEAYVDKQGEVETDWSAYHELTELMGKDPKGFAEVEMLEYRARLSDSEFRWLSAQQVAYRQGKETEINAAATLQQQLSAVHNAMKWSGQTDADKRGRFDQAAYAVISTEESRIGKKLGYEERQKIIDRLLLEGEVIRGSMFKVDPDRRLYEVVGTEDETRFRVNEVPATEREKIVEALRRRGVTVTDERIAELYTKKILSK